MSRRAGYIRAFGMNAYSSSRAGGEIVEEHTEEQLGHEEVYVVVRGHATFHLDGDDVDAPTGTLVVLKDPSVKRQAIVFGLRTIRSSGKGGSVTRSIRHAWAISLRAGMTTSMSTSLSACGFP